MGLFTEITILVVTAAVFALIMRAFKQPLIIGYIITGLVVGPVFFDFIHSEETLHALSEMGISFLLFIVGLNLTPQVIKAFGRTALLCGLGQILFTFAAGLLLAQGLGFSLVTSAYIAIALVFSSTIIVVKLISDKGDMEKLYAKLAIGYLVVQDIVAILILFLVPLFSRVTFSDAAITWTLMKGIGAVAVIFFMAAYIFPRGNRFFAKSQELLFLFAIAWGLGCAALFRAAGFSLESGALLAGVSLSILPSHEEIHARLKPLRDFFVVLFFVLLGARISFVDINAVAEPALYLSLFVLIGNPLILIIILGALGYRKRTSFQTSLTAGQVSEFSFIVLALGERLGHVDRSVSSLVTLVGVITIFVSTYLITHTEALFSFLSPVLSLFERSSARDTKATPQKWDTVLFGFNRIGFDFMDVLKALKGSFLVVDYNPDTIDILKRKRIASLYGDASDVEFLGMINMTRLKLAISTIPDLAVNSLILSRVRLQSPDALVLGVAYTINDAMTLYREGFDYVVMPHFLGGKHASLLVEKHTFNRSAFARLKHAHLLYLRERMRWGHEHPKLEKTRT